MPEFSACYFCGTALDAPLAEYPVIPDALHPSTENQRTVVLCPSCRRKLGAVVDTVVAAVDDPSDAEAIQQGLEESTDAEAFTENDEVNTETPPTETGERIDVQSANDGLDGSGGDPSSADANEAEAGGFEFAEDAPANGAAADQSESESSEGIATDAGTSDSTEVARNAETNPDATGQPVDETSADDGDAGHDSVEAEQDSVEAEQNSVETEQDSVEAETQTDEASSEQTDDEDTPAEEPEMTALEYNKVMRLLQNRAFPVDCEEFKVVATSAYQISDDEFEAVLEAASNRGLIELEGGQIVDG